MPLLNSSVITAISNTQEVKNIVSAGAVLKANQVLDEQTGGNWNAKVQAKRYSLAKRIQDSDERDDVYSSIAMQIMLTFDPFFFLYTIDANDVFNAINDDIFNNVAKVTQDDFI